MKKNICFDLWPYRFLAGQKEESPVKKGIPNRNVLSFSLFDGADEDTLDVFFGDSTVDCLHLPFRETEKISFEMKKMIDLRSGQTVLAYIPSMCDVEYALYFLCKRETIDLLVVKRNYWNNTVAATVFRDVDADSDEAAELLQAI